MGLANQRAMGTELLKEKIMKIKSNVRAGRMDIDGGGGGGGGGDYPPPRSGTCSGVIRYPK
jgi:hypothetical protein